MNTRRPGGRGPVLALLVMAVIAACDSAGVSLEAPDTPSMQAPADGSEQPNALELRWTSVAGAAHYRVQVASDPAFTEILSDAGDVTAPRTALADLSIGSTYFWRVRAGNGAGESEWTDVWSFDVTSVAPRPGPVSLLWPPDEAPYIPRSLTLTWQKANLADMYHVQVSQESAFLRLDANLNAVVGESQFIHNLDSTYVYFWRVRSRNLAGYGPWSATRSFIVEAAVGWVPGT